MANAKPTETKKRKIFPAGTDPSVPAFSFRKEVPAGRFTAAFFLCSKTGKCPDSLYLFFVLIYNRYIRETVGDSARFRQPRVGYTISGVSKTKE